MLISKFSVPIARRAPINPFRFHLYNPLYNCSNRTACNTPKDATQEVLPLKCKEYQEKLSRCPKPTRKVQRDELSSGLVRQYKAKTAADDYGAAYKSVLNHINLLTKTIQEESKLIIENLKNGLNTSKTNREIQLEKLFDCTTKPLEELISLDPSFSSIERKHVLMINYTVIRAIHNLQRIDEVQANRIQKLLNCLEKDVLICTDRAKSLIVSCRKYKNHKELAKCAKENAKYAEQMLDETSKKMQLKLNEIKITQNEILEHHILTVEEIMDEYHVKNKACVKHLENCIFAAKNKS